MDFSTSKTVINETDTEADLNMDLKRIDYKNDMDKIYPIKSKQIIGFNFIYIGGDSLIISSLLKTDITLILFSHSAKS